MSDLLAAVDRLSKPTRLHQPKGSPAEGSTVRHAPLLAQLRDAIVSNITSGGGRSLASQRIPLDPHALATYDRIEGGILDAHAFATGKPAPLHPEQALRAWYVAFTQAGPPAATVEAWAAKVDSWANDIERLLDPPRRLELLDTPCITCGKAETIDADGNLVTAVVAEWRTIDETPKIEQTTCRACQAVWEGPHGASSFRRHSDAQEAATSPYEHENPSPSVRYRDAVKVAQAAFESVGEVYGRVRLKTAPTITDPVWRFTANIRDTPETAA